MVKMETISKQMKESKNSKSKSKSKKMFISGAEDAKKLQKQLFKKQNDKKEAGVRDAEGVGVRQGHSVTKNVTGNAEVLKLAKQKPDTIADSTPDNKEKFMTGEKKLVSKLKIKTPNKADGESRGTLHLTKTQSKSPQQQNKNPSKALQ